LKIWLNSRRKSSAEACREWRQNHGRREQPAPADIRKLATVEKRERDDRARRAAQMVYRGGCGSALDAERIPFAKVAVHQEQQREGRAISDEFARRNGYPDIDAYLDAGGRYADVVRGIATTARGPAGFSTVDAASSAIAAIELTARG